MSGTREHVQDVSVDKLEKAFNNYVDEVKTNPAIIVKGVLSTVVGWGVSSIVVIAVNTIVPKDTLSRKQKLQLSLAAWSLGGATAHRASYWAAEKSTTSTVLCTIANAFKKEDKTIEEASEVVDESSSEKVNKTEEPTQDPQ